uniref:Uncharacterized protein n=1 Tax=Cannabis sativa TaxID=3483 RepID=A0A803R424_CANSA
MELVERIQKAKKEVGPALWPIVLSCLLRGVGLRVHIFIDAIGARKYFCSTMMFTEMYILHIKPYNVGFYALNKILFQCNLYLFKYQ